MAVASTMLELGTELPRFTLPDTVGGGVVDSSTLHGSVAVVAILCNHCPYVRHIQKELAAFASDVMALGVKMVAISPNDVTTHPEDGPEAMAAEAKSAGYPFPYLYDESQDVVKAFKAACTPELYVFDASGKLAYRGRFDESTPKNGAPVTGKDARAAVIALLSGKAPAGEQLPSIGCSIKWKAGNEPEWAR